MRLWWALAGAGTFLAPLAVRRATSVTAAPPGLVDLDAAVAACRATGAHGWGLVDVARRTVGGQFLTYSAMSPWEPTEVAFARRRGYSAQYNVALTQVLRRLGLDATTVFAARVHHDSQRPWWRNAHVWVRVRHDGRVRDVCAGLTDTDGTLRFEPATEVLPFGSRTHLNTTLVLTVAAAYQAWRSLVTRRPVPEFMERPFTALGD